MLNGSLVSPSKRNIPQGLEPFIHIRLLSKLLADHYIPEYSPNKQSQLSYILRKGAPFIESSARKCPTTEPQLVLLNHVPHLARSVSRLSGSGGQLPGGLARTCTKKGSWTLLFDVQKDGTLNSKDSNIKPMGRLPERDWGRQRRSIQPSRGMCQPPSRVINI